VLNTIMKPELQQQQQQKKKKKRRRKDGERNKCESLHTFPLLDEIES
jgi:hypothetical protein